jgi:hypothetical protein
MELKNIRFILIFSVLVFAFLFFSTQDIKAPNIQMPWQSYKNEQQQTVAFGLTINKSSLEEVLRVFGGEAEMALFENNNKYDLEVFFKHTKVGGLSGSLVIALNIGKALTFIKENIKQSNKLPSLKGIKMLINEYAKNKLLHLKIKHLSFIPKASLNKAIITERFGTPNSIKKEKDIEHWIYPKKGLKIILVSEKRNILEYE